MKKMVITLFSDFHYKKGMYPARVSDLEEIIASAKKTGSDLILHAGDFSNDYHGSPEILKAFLHNKAEIPVYGVYGNHELESDNEMKFVSACLSNRPLCWGGEPEKDGYYTADLGEYLLVGLDTNYSKKSDGSWEHNRRGSWGSPAENSLGDSLGSEQLIWLEKVLNRAADEGKHAILVSHAGFSGRWDSSPDHEKVRKIINNANRKAPRTVILCINGHYHTDHAALMDHVLYLDMVTVKNGTWRPDRYEIYQDETYPFDPYDDCGNPSGPTEMRYLKDLTMAPHMWYYTDNLYTTLTIEGDRISYTRKESQWVAGKHVEKLLDGEHPLCSGGSFALTEEGK